MDRARRTGPAASAGGGPSRARYSFLLGLEGEFDIARLDVVEEAAARVSASARLIVDLRELTYIDSIGLTALLRVDERMRAGGGALQCVMPREGPVWRLFELTALNRQIEVREELPD